MNRLFLLVFLTSSLAFGSVPLVTFPQLGTIRAVATDADGNVYVTGVTGGASTPTGFTNSFPVTPGVFQPVWGSHSCQYPTPPPNGLWCKDAFVAKFSPTGKLVYASYLGGSGEEEGMAIAVDPAGDAWVVGYTDSSDFPVTANALQKKNAGGTNSISAHTLPPFTGDAFVAGVNATGTALLYSSYFGGTGPDGAIRVVVDKLGNVYFAGHTESTDLPNTPGSPGPAFVAKLNPGGPTMVYSTYFESSFYDMTADAAGGVYLTGGGKTVVATPGAFQMSSAGSPAFIVKLKPDGSRAYATLLGGSVDEAGYSIAVDAAGAAWVAGHTDSPDFPVTMPPTETTNQAFVAHLSPDGSALLLAFVTPVDTNARSLLLDPSGDIYVSGTGGAVPLTPDALEKTVCSPTYLGLGSFGAAALITKWSPQGTLLYASYSREGQPLGIDSAGRLYPGELSEVPDEQPMANDLFRWDPQAGQRQSGFACASNGASFYAAHYAPGEVISLWGDRLGPDQPARMQLDASGKVSTLIGNTRVLFNGIPAPMLYADANQINVVVPWGLVTGNLVLGKSVTVTVEYCGVPSIPVQEYSLAADPGIFMLQPSLPPSEGVIFNEDHSLNTAANPAARGSVITFYATGLGPLTPQAQDGQIIPDSSHVLQQPLTVLFPGPNGPAAAQLISAGNTSGLVAGVIQIQVRLPDTLPGSVTLPGPVPIYLQLPGGAISPVLATVAVK